MTVLKKILIGCLAAVVLLCLLLGGLAYLLYSGIDDEQNGLKEGISLSAAVDCPIDLPNGATDISYAYQLYWQGGCTVLRYRYPEGDLKQQAEKHLQKVVPWRTISTTTPVTVPEHRFAGHAWFQPTSITSGYESQSSGILWEPKVWIDEAERVIYVLYQN